MNYKDRYLYDLTYNPMSHLVNNRLIIKEGDREKILSYIINPNTKMIDFNILDKPEPSLIEYVSPKIQDTNFFLDILGYMYNPELLEKIFQITQIEKVKDVEYLARYNNKTLQNKFAPYRILGKYMCLAINYGAYSHVTWMIRYWGTIANIQQSYFLEDGSLVFTTNLYDASKYISKITEKLKEQNIHYELKLQCGNSYSSKNPIEYSYSDQSDTVTFKEVTKYKTKDDIPLEKIIISEKIIRNTITEQEALKIALRDFNLDLTLATYKNDLILYAHLMDKYGKTLGDQIYSRIKLYEFLERTTKI